MSKRKTTIEAEDKSIGMTAREIRAALHTAPAGAEVKATVSVGGRIKTLTITEDDESTTDAVTSV